MKLPSLTTIGVVLVASELALVLGKRSKSRGAGKDRYTLPLLWLVIAGSIFLGFYLRERFPGGALPHPRTFYVVGLVLLVLGLIVRWIAIVYLGRFFTVNVAIAKDHQLVTTGPYRVVRHPSYTGTLLVFLGFSFCLLNTFSVAAIFLPICGAFLWRMHVEETALREAFGARYHEYAQGTSRLIPFVY